MHAFSGNIPVLSVKGSFPGTSRIRHLRAETGYIFTALLIFTFFLFSLVHAQSEETQFSDEGTQFSDEGSSAPGEETPAPGEESSTPSEASSFAGDETSAPGEAEPAPSASSSKGKSLVEEPSGSDYSNFAQKGSYENEDMFSEVPQWHYYDMFGNKILDGFYLYGLSMDRNNTPLGGMGNVALHPFYRMWFSGLVQVADIQENGGIMALIGDRVKSEFTPFSLKQTLFAGSRFDVFYKKTSLTLLTNRISETGAIGMLTTAMTKSTEGMADWITGGHARQKFGEDVVNIGGTWVNLHHEESNRLGNPFSGRDSDTLTKKTYNGLSVYGLDLKLQLAKLQVSGEYMHSQEYFDGKFKPKAGNVATLNGKWDIIDNWKLGGEYYTIGSRFQTNFSCPAPLHKNGDYDVGKYQYSLVEDNDDDDEFPENGKSRYLFYTNKDPLLGQGDPDGPIPVNWDKDKNGRWDYEEDFLNYETDPPESQILFDRNNNGIADEIEDDAYPDYAYVPSYYLPGERYWRYDDIDTIWENKWADSLHLVHKGLAGVHLYTRFTIFEGLELTLGGIFDKSQEKTYQSTYVNGLKTGEIYDTENASNIYFLTHFKKATSSDVYFTIDNFFRKVNDNIPNHTQGFVMNPLTEAISYYTVVDELDFRDMFADALRAEFNVVRNRGFNYTAAGKYEFRKNFEHLNFNYPELTINSLTVINKFHYIFLLPFFKDMFLTPKFKSMWDTKGYGPRTDSLPDASLDAKYRRNAMTNTLSLVWDWKMTAKTGLIIGAQAKQFNDLIDARENFLEPGYRIQLQIKDRYAGVVLVLTTGFAQYAYIYETKGWPHNQYNNPHRVVKDIDDHEIFIKIHCGF